MKITAKGSVDKRIGGKGNAKSLPKKAKKYDNPNDPVKKTSLQIPESIIKRAKDNHGTLVNAVKFAADNKPL